METYESHCERSGCRCAHSDCYKGWLDEFNYTRPCAICREHTYARHRAATQMRAKKYPLTAIHRVLREGTRQS